jgi:hypothetical protein
MFFEQRWNWQVGPVIALALVSLGINFCEISNSIPFSVTTMAVGKSWIIKQQEPEIILLCYYFLSYPFKMTF